MTAAAASCLLAIGAARPAAGQTTIGATGPAAGQAAGEEPAGAPRPPPQSAAVAVAPFANVSGHPADAWLGAGVAETVVTGLDRLPAFTVVAVAPAGAAEVAAAGDGAPDEAARLDRARAAGAAWLVAGAFERRGAQLRVTARIVHVETGEVRRTIEVDGDGGSLFDLQDQVTAELRDRLTEAAGLPDAARGAGPAEDAAATALRPRARSGGAFGAAAAEAGTPAVPAPPTGRRPRFAPPPPAPSDGFSPSGPGGPAPEDVTGAIATDDTAPRFGVAAGAGVLTGRPAVRPPRTRIAPIVDGRLDDAVWTGAARITEFVQLSPLDGAPGTEATEVYVAYDSANIYLGFRARYTDPGMLRANRTDRDRAPGDDAFSVYFDPFLDQQRAYVFTVNAYGVQSDGILSARGGGGGGFGGGGGREPRGFFGPPRGDRSWDALFITAGQVAADGFTAEMAIPFKSLRYPRRTGGAPHRWGFQVARRIRGKNETVVWAPVSRAVAGFLPQMGVLDGMTGLSTSRNMEILPTFTALRFGTLDESGRFGDGAVQPEGGVNFKYGVTSNLTADVTFNPDFSQIESDRPQIEVNQRFELFFPELRPFFLEGAEIFQFRGPVNLVHTRTIIDPRYGAKLTGKAGDTTIGVMYANDEAAGEADDAGAAAGRPAHTFVGRMRYDLYAESYVGAIFTGREFAGSFNRVAGVDSNFRLGTTHAFGVRAVSARDRGLDGTEASGYLLDASFRKTGRNLSYLLAHYALSPGFTTDVGFVRRTDQRATFSNVAYRWWPEHWVISWGPDFNYMRGYNFAGILEDEQASGGLSFSFTNNMRLDASLHRDMERFGGIDFSKTRYRLFGVVSASRRFSFGLGANGGDQIFFDEDNPYLGRDNGWSGFLNLRVFPRWQSRINVNTNRFVDVRDGGALAFDVNVFRALTTYQFTDRLALRSISEYNSFDRKLSLNLLLTYRVNAGTVFYVGYDDRRQRADLIERDVDGDGMDDRFFPSTALKRTNRAIFTKLQYLFRY